jgi:E3 ubiquitin-protein ligase RNF115/126
MDPMESLFPSFMSIGEPLFMSNFMSNFGMRQNRSGLMDYILRMSEMDRGREGNPTRKDVLENLPEIDVRDPKYEKKNEKGEVELPTCSVCFEEMKEKATMLPCGHMYDRECIEPWLKDHNVCPTCRHELPS